MIVTNTLAYYDVELITAVKVLKFMPKMTTLIEGPVS
jgi:hypothetical protein